jgi:outer membrane immunogenic protein
MRKKIAALILAGTAMLAGGAALADGMPGGSIKDTPVAPMTTWSGFYLGGGVGYGHMIGKDNYSENGVLLSSNNNDSAAGGFGTVVVGFDRQVRERYVVGLFAEYDWGNIELTDLDINTGDTTHFRVRDAFSLGGRAGFLMTPQSLLFVTAGYTWASGKSDGYFDIIDTADNVFPGKTKLDLNGPFVGVGMETQLAHNWSMRGEVRYTMFSEVTTNSGVDGPIAFVDKIEGSLLTGRLAVVYKFNREEAPVEPIK